MARGDHTNPQATPRPLVEAPFSEFDGAAGVELSDVSIERIATRVVELVKADALPTGLVNAKELARVLDVSREYVYRHRRELGGIPIGGGDKPRLRFSIPAALKAREHIEAPPTPQPSIRRRAVRSDVPLLPIRGRP